MICADGIQGFPICAHGINQGRPVMVLGHGHASYITDPLWGESTDDKGGGELSVALMFFCI